MASEAPSHPAAIDVYGYPLQSANIVYWRDAVEHAQRGEMPAAARLLGRVLDAQPEFAPAMVQASHFLLAADHYRDARALALRAGETMPGSHELALEIVRILRKFEEHARIERFVERIDWRPCRSALLLVQLAGELGPIGLYRQASFILDLVETLDPRHAQAQYLRGTIRMVSGDMDGARKMFESALRDSPRDLPHVRWMLSLQADNEIPGTDIEEVDRLLDRADSGSESEAYLAFAKHNLLHAAGRFDEAWHALMRGCRAKRAHSPYRREAQHALFDALHVMPTLAAAPVPRSSGSTRLVFIVGMHRSGTSLLERVLAGHREVTDGGESYVFTAQLRRATDHFCSGIVDESVIARMPHADLASIGSGFREYALWRAQGRPYLTEKLPSNFLNLGFILAALPDARILHMRRDPIDTCFSNLRTFFSQAAPYSYDPLDLADYYLRYRRLMRHWHAIAPGRILDVDYRAFVEDPESEARHVAAFCGLDFQPNALDVTRSDGHSATASVASVRRGILRDRSAAWTPYMRHLQPMIEALRPAYDDGG